MNIEHQSKQPEKIRVKKEQNSSSKHGFGTELIDEMIEVNNSNKEICKKGNQRKMFSEIKQTPTYKLNIYKKKLSNLYVSDVLRSKISI